MTESSKNNMVKKLYPLAKKEHCHFFSLRIRSVKSDIAFLHILRKEKLT